MALNDAGYIVETGITSFGKVVQNFFELSTYSDPLRTSNFPQNWTIYYWAYWMVWCVAAPFFIGSISRGRSIRQTILPAKRANTASRSITLPGKPSVYAPKIGRHASEYFCLFLLRT